MEPRKENVRELYMILTEKQFLDFQQLRGILRSPNLATAICGAVSLVLDFYENEDNGYKIFLQPPYTRELTEIKMPRGKRT